MQYQADMLGLPVLRSESADASALGAAYLAGLAVGVWEDLEQIVDLPRPRERVEPRMPQQQRAALYGGWKAAVARATLDPESTTRVST